MHETGKAGAGMAERSQHHVLADEFREWFEKRGFTGEWNRMIMSVLRKAETEAGRIGPPHLGARSFQGRHFPLPLGRSGASSYLTGRLSHS
jgi:hypothetical protein